MKSLPAQSVTDLKKGYKKCAFPCSRQLGCLIGVCALLWGAAWFPPPAWSAPASGRPNLKAPAKQELKVKAKRMDYDENRKVVRLVEDVVFTTGATVMTSSYAEYNTETQIGQFKGNVKVQQPGTVVTGDVMKVFYKENRVQFSGNVTMHSESLASRLSRDAKAQPVVIKSKNVTYNWENNTAQALEGVAFMQGDRRGYADSCFYDKRQGTALLKGNVRFEQGKDDWITCDELSVDIVKETAVAQGQVNGRFLFDAQTDVVGTSEKAGTDKAEPEREPMQEPELPYELVEKVKEVPLPGT